jgi:hypothetical protein
MVQREKINFIKGIYNKNDLPTMAIINTGFGA